MQNTFAPKRNKSTDSSRFLSPALWGGFPVAEIRENPSIGIFNFDDFTDLPLTPTLTTQIGFGKYKAFATTGSSVTRVSAFNSVEVMGGGATHTTDTDNDSASLFDAYPSYYLSNSRNTSGKLVFECCYAQNSIAGNMAAVIFGLGEVEQWTLATGVPLNGGDSPTNAGSFIGFRIEENGLGVVDTVYSDRATSFTNIGDTEGGTMVANTFAKYGFVYDPSPTVPDAQRITFYVNNQPLTTKLSGTALTALTNLDANCLGRMWTSCAGSGGTSFAGYMKWWAVGQIFPGQS